MSAQKYYYDRFYEYLYGKQPLPDTLAIQKDCKNNHGVEGLTVRLNHMEKSKHLGSCLRCHQQSNKRASRSVYAAEKRWAESHALAQEVEESSHGEPLFLT